MSVFSSKRNKKEAPNSERKSTENRSSIISLSTKNRTSVEHSNQEHIESMMRVVFQEMIKMNDKIRANKGQIQNYNLFSNPVIHEVGMYLKDKKILTHYFERLQNLFEDNDALDQSKKKSQVRFGLTPDEFKDQQDKKMQL